MTNRRLPHLAILALFLVSRMLYETINPGVGTIRFDDPVNRAGRAVSGENLELSTLGEGMPLLSEDLLRNDLWRSLWYLHSQPPVFNLLVAWVLGLPGSDAIKFQILNWVLAFAVYLMTFDLARRLGASAGSALLFTLAFLLNPNAMWMESAVYYGVWIAFFLTFAAWSLHRAMERESRFWLVGAAALVMIIPLTRAYFTMFWLLAVGAMIVAAKVYGPMNRFRWRTVLACALLPLSVLLLFQLKQFVMFGQFAGSSWLGCNLASMTAAMTDDKRAAVESGDISSLALVYRNSPPEVFLEIHPMETTGVPALDQISKSTGDPNFNHMVYVPVCRQYLTDTLRLIRRNPAAYLGNVINSIYIFSGIQMGMYFNHPAEFLSRWSWLEIVAPLIGFPLILVSFAHGVKVLVRGQRSEASWWAIVFMMITITYVSLVAVLVEKGEGPLYRYQIDSFLVILLSLALTSSRVSTESAEDSL